MQIGNVIRIYAPDARPDPKVKYMIVVGVTSELLGTIFINTEVNPNSLNSTDLQALHIPLDKLVCTFLTHDSYADCSEISERNKSEINNLLQKDPGRNEGKLPKGLLNLVLDTVKRAKTIAPETKKKFGL